MEIFKEIQPLKTYLKGQRVRGNTIGLVPTMGALHQGHVSLIKASKRQNQITICSIFVNPTQFNNPDDLLKYPRTIEKDSALLSSAGCDAIFYPEVSEMYTEQSVMHFDFGDLGKVMEGKFRPGHFSGVALVVSKFFNIVQPDNAYFGQKDWQQFAVIQKLVDELKFDLALHRVDTLREPDGLAMSSRNLRLTESERKKANVFYEAMNAAKSKFNTAEDLASIKKYVKDLVEANGVSLEYFELADSKNLNLLDSVKDAKNQPIMCIAGYVGDVRLIDNMFLE